MGKELLPAMKNQLDLRLLFSDPFQRGLIPVGALWLILIFSDM